MHFPLLFRARKISRVISDHNPIMVDTGEKLEMKNKEFRFEKSWIQHLDYQDGVKSASQANVQAVGIIQVKLKKVKDSLKGWGGKYKRGFHQFKEITHG
jgi:hypothetical protein